MTILASSLALANADYTWRSDAICRDTDPELFFPVGTTGYALVQIDRAKEVCGAVPRAQRLPRLRPRDQPGLGHLGRHLARRSAGCCAASTWLASKAAV